ncbi:MAG: hypothetical protein ABR508_11690 [Candidatus Baltobacteraceae bacterium]
MKQDETASKMEALCGRLEDLIDAFGAALERRPGPYAKLRETYPNAGKAWSGAHDEELRRLFTAGNTIADLALLFGRTHNGVRQRLERLGLIETALNAA